MEKGAHRRAGTAGLVAAGVAIGLSELWAGLFERVPSLLAGIGGAVVDWAPPFLKDFAIAFFGTADKSALAIGTVVLSLAIGWSGGILAAKRRWIGILIFGAFGILGFAAGINEPLVSNWATGLSVIVSATAGLATLEMLLRSARVPEPTDAAAADAARRRFLGMAAGGAVVAATAGVVGRRLLSALPSTPELSLPAPAAAVDPPGAAEEFAVQGLTPIVVENRDFFRIDTALVIPRIDLETWKLRIHGDVDREIQLSYDELAARPLIEEYVTIACVSNEVGGSLVGNAAWTGVSLVDLLDEAGVSPRGTQIVGRSVDGFTAGFPTELAFDGRAPMVAIGMNGEPLPRRHGFPARLIVPGLYGYVSATKWLAEIELTGFDTFDAYWVPRGWAKEAPIKTQSRIDVPRSGADVGAGAVAAGVAWAPTRGISAVELQVDDGAWQPCEVSQPLSSRAWVQWRIPLELAPGDHELRVRATDGNGETQTAERQGARPDGATGYHTVAITAS